MTRDPRHGYAALVREYIQINPDTPRRLYGHGMMRRLADQCQNCREADAQHVRLRRMHAAYRRRST
jgi:hypothetical protein